MFFAKKQKKNAIKECVYHALWQCDKIKNLYEDVAKELGIEKFTSFPLTAKQIIIWDEGLNENSPINLLNAIWTITVNEVLRSQDSDKKMDSKNVAKVVKGEIIASNCAYPNKNVSREVGRLGLLEFMASKSFNSI